MLREKVTNVISKKPILFLTFFEMTRTHFYFKRNAHAIQIKFPLFLHIMTFSWTVNVTD